MHAPQIYVNGKKEGYIPQSTQTKKKINDLTSHSFELKTFGFGICSEVQIRQQQQQTLTHNIL